MFKNALKKLMELVGKDEFDFPQATGKPERPKRKYVTMFRASWDMLQENRRKAGMIVSGETRRVLRAQLKRRLSKVKV